MRKAYGIIFIAIGGLISLNFLRSLGEIIKLVANVFKDSGSNNTAAHLGYLTGYLVFFVIGFIFLFFGIKAMKPPKSDVNEEEVN